MARGSVDESFLGCPGLLLKAIRFISTERDIVAAKRHYLLGSERESHITDLTAIVDLVSSFDCYKALPEIRREDPQPDQRNIRYRCALSEVYKIGTLIYGKRVLAMLTGEEINLDELVSKLLESLTILQNEQGLLNCALWPLFIAGLECRSPDQRQYFVTHLEKFWMATRCWNAINAAKLLEEHWQLDKERLCWPFDHGRFGRVWLLM